MIREITLGQYYETDSVLHRLDPRVKLLFTILYIASLYIGKGVLSYVLAFSFLVVIIILSKVPLKFMMRGLRGLIVILCISSALNLFLVKGEVLWSWWKFTICKEGVSIAVQMVIRLVFLIIGSSLMTLTTTPNNLTDGMEKGLKFLKVIRIPVHEIAMMMSIALRFIPILVDEVNKIMKAQMARGADFDKGGLIKKAKAMVPLLIPLFISAFRRASDLAQAMEARCYHGDDGRTKLHPLKYQRRDYVAYIIMAIYLAGMILLRIFAADVINLWSLIHM